VDTLSVDKAYHHWFDGPLTQDDIAEIEILINTLMQELLEEDPAALAEELAKPLPDKIEAYLEIADYAETDPDLTVGPELSAALRGLLKAVNSYNRGRN
jgi:hypothetical protein